MVKKTKINLISSLALGLLLFNFGQNGLSNTEPLRSRNIAEYQQWMSKEAEKKAKEISYKREKEIWESKRFSKDTTIVRFISLGKEKIRLETGFKEYFERKNLYHLDDSSWENVISYTHSDDKIIEEVLKKIKIPSDDLEKDAQKILDFVHRGFVYLKERDSYPKSPLETIVEGGGDCEDLALLTASLMKKAGMDIVYVAIPGKNSNPPVRSHLIIGVHGNFDGKFIERDGKKYYLTESTGTSSILSEKKIGKWKVGQIYESFEKRLGDSKIYTFEDSLKNREPYFFAKNSKKDK